MIIFRLAIFLLLLTACSSNDLSISLSQMQRWREPNGRVKVLTTIAMIDDIVRQVGNDFVDSLVLIKGELDPHSYQLVKGDDEKLLFADLIFYNGLGLEHGPSLQQHLHSNPKAIPLGNRLQTALPQHILHYNGQLDPHIWMDISLWLEIIPFIVEALSDKDPLHAENYRSRGSALRSQMLAAHDKIKTEMAAIPENKRYLVTSHDAFNYFTRAYLATDEERRQGDWQKRFAAPEGLAPESQLSTTDIQLIINHLRKYNVHVLFPESNVSKDSIKKIFSAGSEKGLELRISPVPLYGDAMGHPGSDSDTYLKMIQHNASVIIEQLGAEQK